MGIHGKWLGILNFSSSREIWFYLIKSPKMVDEDTASSLASKKIGKGLTRFHSSARSAIKKLKVSG